MNYQKLILVGNATDAAKVERSEGKTAYADFTVAVRRSREKTDFFPVRAFGKLAEAAEGISKGTTLLVEGRVEIDRFTSKDGRPLKTIRVLADTVRIVYQPGAVSGEKSGARDQKIAAAGVKKKG